MPKPPLIIAPAPNEPIASQAWGVPVTDHVNGAITGHSFIGMVLHTNEAGQSMTGTFAIVTLTDEWLMFDSDGFLDAANNRIVVPAGLNGLYRLDYHIATTTWDAPNNSRMAIIKNGGTFWQEQSEGIYNSVMGFGFSGIIPMNDGDTIYANTQKSGANQTIKFKNIVFIRIGDLPPAAKPAPEPPTAEVKPAPEPPAPEQGA